MPRGAVSCCGKVLAVLGWWGEDREVGGTVRTLPEMQRRGPV